MQGLIEDAEAAKRGASAAGVTEYAYGPALGCPTPESALCGLGTSVEWLFRRATQRARGHLDALPSETVKERLHIVTLRFGVCGRSGGGRLLSAASALPRTRLAAAAARGVVWPAHCFSYRSDRKCRRS